MSYDADGNLVDDGVNRYLYDGEGRLCATQSHLTLGMTGYLYDGKGYRLSKGSLANFSCDMRTNGYTASSIYAVDLNGNQLEETDGSFNLVHANVFLDGKVLATYAGLDLSPTDWHYSLNDWVGTRRVQANFSGASEITFPMLAWGEGQATGGATENQFTGKERDIETGNDYFDARYYGSTMGRFMSPDPSGLFFADLGNPQSFNLYSYALNNPLSKIDPTGLYCEYYGDTDENDTGASFDFQSNSGECGENDGKWFNDPTTTVTVNGNTGDVDTTSIFTGNTGTVPNVSTQTSHTPGSFSDCVMSGTDGFSLQSGLQNISGGRLGNGWVAGAFLGSSVSSIITLGQYGASLFSPNPGAPTGSQTANSTAAEAVGDAAGPAADATAKRVPNLAVTAIATARVGTISATGEFAVAVPLSAAANTGAKVLGALGTFKLPYDLSVAAFSAVVCGVIR